MRGAAVAAVLAEGVLKFTRVQLQEGVFFFPFAGAVKPVIQDFSAVKVARV